MELQKVIWTCWLQGRTAAPELVERCLSSWEAKNPGWELRCLDEYTVGRYIDLGSHIDLSVQEITAASLSDIIGVLLLHEFGGVWVDPMVFCNQPLDEWLPAAASTGFFAFAGPDRDRLPESWFVAAASGNKLLGKWASKAATYWRARSNSTEYFWFDHLFGELCSLDGEARRAWAAVPKISVDGPHSLQNAKGLSEPFTGYDSDVDWMSPVFKLAYPADHGDYGPGCLLHRVVYGGETDTGQQVPPKTATMSGNIAPTRFAGLKVGTDNLGDHIQLLAAYRLLGRAGIVPDPLLDRDDEIASARALEQIPAPVGILMSGWHKFGPAEWPPNPKLDPIYLSFHIRLFQSPTLLGPAAIEHYRKFGPIGCRDPYTASLLKQKGVDAFVSHCLSLSYSRRLVNPESQTETYVVSRDRKIFDHLAPKLGQATFITHYSGSNDFDENMRSAADLITMYRQRAKLIVTTMLHCALPAIAMGIPVIVFYPFNKRKLHTSDRERFSSLEQLVPVFHPSEMEDVDWNGYLTDVSTIKLRLLDRFYQMAADRWSLSPQLKLGSVAASDALPAPRDEHLSGASVIKSPLRGRISQMAERWSLARRAKLGSVATPRGMPARNLDQRGDFCSGPEQVDVPPGAKQPDRKRWRNRASYLPSWAFRSRQAAALIPDNATVLEIGTGVGHFRALVKDRCKYLGTDLEPLDAETLAVDLDSDPLPPGPFDYVVSLGVFEYLHAPAEAAQKLSSAGRHIVISYCCRHESGKNDADAIKLGWVNALGESEFVKLFEATGKKLLSRDRVNLADAFEQVLFHFA